MKDKVILGTIVMLVSLNTSLTGLANEGNEARNDAEVAVISQEEVSVQRLRSHGDEYTREFLIQFHNATQKYRQAFQLGIADQLAGQTRSFDNPVEQAAYQKGLEQEKQWGKENDEQKDSHIKNSGVSEPLLDQEKYPHRQPLPNQARFIARIAKHAQQIGKEFDLYPSIIIAQAALESNWGSSDLSLAPHHNLFGVKGHFGGQGTLKSTTEFINGRPRQVQDIFRSYTSDIQSLRDYAETLQQPLYKQVHRSVVKDYREATRALVGRYATDPNYDKKLNQIIESYQLTRYDGLKKSGSENSLTRGYQQLEQPPKKHVKASSHRTLPKHKKISPVVSIVGGAASAGVLTGLKKLLIS
ncbi:glycoside hydrolase family 73 protein [Limosilactobacillus fastidiosus]|uniref:Glycoside hydrolase family 73 protein n=1 Tax=Limosilactobacillus fastidiosus TaxID=2759855 RepID=A0A7W3YDA1_9LACO|nr:glycoside hydrolase family 73 protein [Limosilactobacillus fastidiosus]MBB1063588.1 glycoside hydrolase family 73 protein [Limosilactobacillus fastidiosus]MBB1086837.1 glycoside hydrolase family 73 protein [Limosilactobacillus fastidiosus]MCD7084164.1 glycoside hydrolase family 73 protein [Limosilactobacillus fastidiosus]MCD7085436.1 glycoside hydrolase family 73 protein [Limosilactobacillus fastidiosus]MCD7114667.1 glycoside hydrolase family 73 protein [Limosilactobacillus fastidiosus]